MVGTKIWIPAVCLCLAVLSCHGFVLNARDNEDICEGIDGTGAGCDHQGNETVCLGLGCCLVSGGCFMSNADPVGPPGMTCDVSSKIDCGVLGTNRDSCIASGCCWYTSTVEGEPWCYEGVPGASNQTSTTTPATTPAGTGEPSQTTSQDVGAGLYCGKEDADKRECSGSTEAGCLDNGCCWIQADPAVAPSCFYGLEYVGDLGECSVDAENKESCGDQNDRSLCLSDGCCWDPTMDPEEPDCYAATESGSGEVYCVKDDEDKRSCGDEGIDSQACLDINCCWDDAASGPACYYGLEYDGPLEECVVEGTDKLPCGDPNDRDACLSAGCCWSPTEDVAQADCYSPDRASVTEETFPPGSPTTTTSGEIEDICEGIDGTGPGCDHQGNETVCLGLGCCLVNGGCFMSNADPVGPPGATCPVSNKIDCGVLGTNRDSCIASGCCWYTSTVEGEPWCYETEPIP